MRPVMVSENAHNSNFAYLHILTLSDYWYAKRREALPSISLTGIGQLVKMLTTP